MIQRNGLDGCPFIAAKDSIVVERCLDPLRATLGSFRGALRQGGGAEEPGDALVRLR